ncbi:MAG TPA: cytochrome c [Alphaproteobacteria bacterium]|nr:cytochrome c [Alphaproteobacteria bacterium]
MKRFILGWVAGLATVGLVGLAVVQIGAYDVAASTPHSALVAWAVHTTMIHSVQLRSSPHPAPQSDAERVAEGFREYDSDCVACHGGPGIDRASWAKGMNPTPPYLLDAARHWTPGQLFWIVKHGVKMTGMPSWEKTKSDRELGDLVAFLEALPTMSADDYRRMRAASKSPPKSSSLPS